MEMNCKDKKIDLPAKRVLETQLFSFSLEEVVKHRVGRERMGFEAQSVVNQGYGFQSLISRESRMGFKAHLVMLVE